MIRRTNPEQIKLTVAPGEKEIYESVGAKIVEMSDPAMSTVTMALIEETDSKAVIFKLVKMFAPIKNHA